MTAYREGWRGGGEGGWVRTRGAKDVERLGTAESFASLLATSDIDISRGAAPHAGPSALGTGIRHASRQHGRALGALDTLSVHHHHHHYHL